MVKSVYPICHYVREHICASKHTFVSSAPSSGADPTKTSILIRISIFELPASWRWEYCKCFPIGGVKSMSVNILRRDHYNFTNYQFWCSLCADNYFLQYFLLCWTFNVYICVGWREVFCPVSFGRVSAVCKRGGLETGYRRFWRELASTGDRLWPWHRQVFIRLWRWAGCWKSWVQA